jgi:hypothetical protein
MDGRKYITNPKPKNGKKIKVERIMTALPLYSLALSSAMPQRRNTNAIL